MAETALKTPASETNVKRAARFGLYGGLAAVFISTIGMLVAFNERTIIHGVLDFGYTLLLIIPFLVGYLSARPPPALEGQAPPEKGLHNVVEGLISGTVTAGLLTAFLILINFIDIRSVFLNVSPELLETLALNQDLEIAVVILLAVGAILGAAGGAIHLLSQRWRRILIMVLVWVLVVGVFQEVFAQIMRGLRLGFLEDVFFVGTGGLTAMGLLIVVAVAGGLYIFLPARIPGWRARMSALPASQRRRSRYVAVFVLIIILAILPQIVGVFLSEVLDLVLLFLLMALGLNIVIGFAGLLDLGYVAFFAVGAYVTAVLVSPGSPLFNPELSFWMALPFVVIAAAIAGLLVGAPVLHLRGDYLAIVTLGFGEIARILALSDWFKPVLGGAQGIISIPNIPFGPLELNTPPQLYYPILIFCAIVAYASWRLQDSRMGRAWMAMREDEPVAEVMGVNIVSTKLYAFVTGAIMASLSGALFAMKIGSVFPDSFKIEKSILILVLIIIGGIGSIPGVMLGALALIAIPELLREFDEFRFLAYGALLIGMMLLRPQGILPSRRWGRELKEEELEQDAWVKDKDSSEAAPEAQTPASGQRYTS
jgi:branched-chain amino acid transport system permease protein